jgi:hypothetical protein
MTKEQVLALWRFGDDSAAARHIGITQQAVQYWRTKGKKSKYEDEIIRWAQERFKNRRRKKSFVVVDVTPEMV